MSWVAGSWGLRLNWATHYSHLNDSDEIRHFGERLRVILEPVVENALKTNGSPNSVQRSVKDLPATFNFPVLGSRSFQSLPKLFERPLCRCVRFQKKIQRCEYFSRNRALNSSSTRFACSSCSICRGSATHSRFKFCRSSAQAGRCGTRNQFLTIDEINWLTVASHLPYGRM